MINLLKIYVTWFVCLSVMLIRKLTLIEEISADILGRQHKFLPFPDNFFVTDFYFYASLLMDVVIQVFFLLHNSIIDSVTYTHFIFYSVSL